METVAPRMPSAPRQALPAGACDTHAHVFGPYDRFPFGAVPPYPPPLAPCPAYREMLATLGATRGVLTQPAPYGADPAAMLDALRHGGGALRGVAVTTADVTDATLAGWHAAGVRALRFTEMPDPRGGGRYAGSVGTEELERLAPRLRELGWHAQLWARAEDHAALLPRLLPLGVPLVLDHLAGVSVARGTADPAFQAVLAALREGGLWVKLTLCRASRAFPDYPDLRPFHDALIEANPDRLLWGSDWPFVRMGELTPDAGHLLDLLSAWVPEEGLRRRILVDNPAALYGFEGGQPC
jgi:predicted TIM-barrel fold metal-dependent hydrolase